MHWLTYRYRSGRGSRPASSAAIARTACWADGKPLAHAIRSSSPSARRIAAASPTPLTSGCDTERRVWSTIIRPAPSTANPARRASSDTRKPAVQTTVSAPT